MVILMRKYYLFNVKEEITRIYKDNPYGLYKTYMVLK